MPVNLTVPKPADLHPVPGVRVGVAMAGVRKANRKDLVAFVLDAGTVVAGVFTQNRFCAAPVQVCREHLASGDHDGQDGIRALVINTGNANAGTGADGLARARRTCEAAAGLLGIKPAAGAAVLHRRDHGDAARRAHRGRPARRVRRPGGRQLGAGRRRHHDHRHAAQGRVDAGHDRRQDGHRHRHQQGRRHDPPEHGHDAGLPGHRRRDRRAAAAGARQAGGRRVVQPHHDRRRHLHQRQLRRDGHAAGRPRAHRFPGLRRRPGAGRGGDAGRAAAGPGHRARRRGRHQVHHGAHRRRHATRPSAGSRPTRSRTRRWSRPRSSRATRTSAASSPRSATRASPISTSRASTCSWTTSPSSPTAAAAPTTGKRTAPA